MPEFKGILVRVGVLVSNVCKVSGFCPIWFLLLTLVSCIIGEVIQIIIAFLFSSLITAPGLFYSQYDKRNFDTKSYRKDYGGGKCCRHVTGQLRRALYFSPLLS